MSLNEFQDSSIDLKIIFVRDVHYYDTWCDGPVYVIHILSRRVIT